MDGSAAVTWTLIGLLAVAGVAAWAGDIGLMALLAAATAPVFAGAMVRGHRAGGPAPARVVGVLSAAVLAHVGFHVLDIYSLGEMDLLLHVVTPFAFGLLVVVVVARFAVPHGLVGDRPFAIGLLAFLATVGMATAWEVYEFIFDHTFGTASQDDLADTMYDLMGGMVAGLAAGTLGPRWLNGGRLEAVEREFEALVDGRGGSTPP